MAMSMRATTAEPVMPKRTHRTGGKVGGSCASTMVIMANPAISAESSEMARSWELFSSTARRASSISRRWLSMLRCAMSCSRHRISYAMSAAPSPAASMVRVWWCGVLSSCAA
jgi:hypothetical protein